MTTLFVTGAGTGVGKTLVMTVLIRQLRGAGRPVRALKPVATGCDETRLDDTDTGRLLEALGSAPNREAIALTTPWRYAAALSPDMAAAREGRTVPFSALLDFCRSGGQSGVVTLIEGIGGVMVPLDEQHTVLDWIGALGAPVLLVAGSYLGTLSHTLTAAGMLRARRCTLAGVIVSESPDQPVALQETAATLQRFIRAPVAILPRLSTPDAAPDLLPLVAPYLDAKNRG